jgi:hypothetical protein
MLRPPQAESVGPFRVRTKFLFSASTRHPVLFLNFRPVALLAAVVLLSGEVHQHGRKTGLPVDGESS